MRVCGEDSKGKFHSGEVVGTTTGGDGILYVVVMNDSMEIVSLPGDNVKREE